MDEAWRSCVHRDAMEGFVYGQGDPQEFRRGWRRPDLRPDLNPAGQPPMVFNPRVADIQPGWTWNGRRY